MRHAGCGEYDCRLSPLLRGGEGDRGVEASAVTLDVEERDSWVHWLLLENDPLFLDHRARALRQCADAVRTPRSRPAAEDGDDRREELLHWLEADGPLDH